MNKVVAILAALVLANTWPAVAQQGTGPVHEMAEQSVFSECIVLSIAALGNRVHIECQRFVYDEGPRPIRFFAVENTNGNSALALAVLSVANAAIDDAPDGCTEHDGSTWACDRHWLIIHYRTNPNVNPAGCLASDCRRIVGVALRRHGTGFPR